MLSGNTIFKAIKEGSGLRMNQENRLLEGIQAVKSSGRANIFDKRLTAIMVGSYGYWEEAEKLQNMSPSKYHFLLENDFQAYLDSK